MFEILITLLFVLPPVILWLVQKPITLRFVNHLVTLTSIGQISGLIGASLLMVVLVFSTRPKFLENKFGGLDKIYKYHHLIGIISFVALLIHPITLSLVQLKITLLGIVRYFALTNYWPMNFGILATLLMTILLVLTLFFRPTYKIWKITHKFLGLVLAIAVLHIFLIGSDISMNMPLKIYMLFITSVGLSSAIYQIIFSNKLRKKIEYKVSEVKQYKKVIEISLEPVDKKIENKNGQFIFLRFISDNVRSESHPFSIAPGKTAKTIRIIISKVGDYTKSLEKLEIGSKALLEGPYGHFGQNISYKSKQIWIAGGIGVVPFLGMAKSIPKGISQVVLYYLVKDSDEAIYLNELVNDSRGDKRLLIIPHYSKNSSHLDINKIKKDVPDFMNSEFLICGPSKMTKNLSQQLIGNGVVKKYLHSELFEY